MNTKDRDILLSILEKKNEWLTKMRDVTKTFTALLDKDDVDAFADGLRQREEIIKTIDALTKIEKQIKGIDTEQAELLKQQSREMMREILTLDEQNTALAQEKIGQYKEQIRSLNQQKKGIGQYARIYKKNEAYYFDQKK